VPRGAPKSEGDLALERAAAPVYREYSRRRARWHDDALALWREWLVGSPAPETLRPRNSGRPAALQPRMDR